MNNVWRGTSGLPPPSKLEKLPYDLSCVSVNINQTKKIIKKSNIAGQIKLTSMAILRNAYCN